VATLLTIYDLHTAPLETVRAVARWQGHPAVAYPPWGPRIVRGAWWRSQFNLAFFEAVRIDLVGHRSAA